jgi:hypothetical protein
MEFWNGLLALLVCLEDFGIGSVVPDTFDPFQARLLRLVALTCGDDLAVGCLEPEPEFPGLVLIDFEFPSGHGFTDDMVELTL